MKQKTKVCSGKHGCGKELSLDMFYINKKYNKPQTYCKKCVCKQSQKWENSHKDRKAKRMHLYHQTESGKAVLKRAVKKYRMTSKGKEWYRAYWEKYRNDLRNGYIKIVLKSMKIKNPTLELIEVKRSQLLLHRQIQKTHGNK